MPDVYDCVRIGTTQFDYVRGEARLRDALVQAFPREVRAIDRYFAVVKRCLRRMPLFFVGKTLPTVPDRLLGGVLRGPAAVAATRRVA